MSQARSNAIWIRKLKKNIYKLVNHQLFTVRLILLSFFMYRITIVLKTELPETGPIIPHHSSLISKPCVLTLLARVYHLLNG